jgi:hypothetical protein
VISHVRRGEPRSKAGWLARVILSFAVIALGSASVLRSVASYVAERDIALAHRLAPGDARLTARFARSVLDADVSPDSLAEAEALARTALRRDATAVEAAATLGFVDELRGQGLRARRWFDYSEQLTRRDLPTNLWLIEHAVADGHVRSALRHYDIALRTQLGASSLLFPILASASRDGAIMPDLVRLLASGPLWSADFMTYLANNDKAPAAAAQLVERIVTSGGRVADTVSTTLVNRMYDSGEFDAAWAHHAARHPRADRRRSRDPQFTALVTAPSRFDWTTLSDTGVTATIQRGAINGVASLYAAPSVGGPLLTQAQVLPAGRYSFRGHSSGITLPREERPYWVLTCISPARELGRIDLPNSASIRGGLKAASWFRPIVAPNR